jgi:Tfp pilus assembly protein PilX
MGQRRPARGPGRSLRPPMRRQRGATLLVVISLLLAIGLMSMTAFVGSRGQYQLVGNVQHQERAFSQAEAASAVAEEWLSDPANAQLADFATYNPAVRALYPANTMASLGLDPRTMGWNNGNSIAVGEGRYLIEQIARSVSLPGGSLQVGQASTGACRKVDLFRVVAQSASVRGSSRMVETFFATDGCY